MKKKRYSSSPFGAMQNAAVGMTGLGITTAIGAGIAAQAPAGSPSLMGGFSALSNMAPVATTAYVGGSIIKNMKHGKRKRSIY